MTVDYSIFDPTKNITIFVDSQIPVRQQADISSALLKAETSAEQVGFVSFNDTADICIRMAGGEFCGNAAMSAGAYYCKLNSISSETDVSVSISGCAVPLNVHIIPQDRDDYIGEVAMPLPKKIYKVSLPCSDKEISLPAVEYEGITHLIVSADEISCTEGNKYISEWCRTINCDALGIMFYDESTSAVTPLVYVKNINSVYWENSCASGTSALGTWLFSVKEQPFRIQFSEPGGTLSVTAASDGSITLSGHTSFIKRSFIKIE